MDEFSSTISGDDIAVPEELRSLFNHPDEIRVQPLPCDLPGLKSMAVHFGAGARTVPHVHHGGQQLVYTNGVGVVGDESGVRVVQGRRRDQQSPRQLALARRSAGHARHACDARAARRLRP